MAFTVAILIAFAACNSKPKPISNNVTMAIEVNLKGGDRPKTPTTFLYNNEDAQFYCINDQNKLGSSVQIDSASLKKIRNSCFWGVASAK